MGYIIAVEIRWASFVLLACLKKRRTKKPVNKSQAAQKAFLAAAAKLDDNENLNIRLVNPEPISPISPSEHIGIDAVGMPVTHNYTVTYEEPSEESIPVENISEIYEKHLVGIDVTYYGTMFGSEGINPLTNFPLTMFNYNVTKLIGLHFTPPEKILSEVVEIYMKATPKFINKFNFDMDEPIMGYKEVIESFPGYKKLRRYEMIQKSFDMKKKIGLNSEIERAKRDEVMKLKRGVHKRTMEKIREEEYAEMKKARDEKVITDRENLRTNHHVDTKNFQSLFSGISNLFVSLFGA